MQAPPSCLHYIKVFGFVSGTGFEVLTKVTMEGTNYWVFVSFGSAEVPRYFSALKTEAIRSFETSVNFTELHAITTQKIVFF
jgi:hypothetical protein